MNRNDYLEYVRVLHERLSNEATQNGVTKWALVVGIVYLLLQIVPEIGQLRKGNLELEHFIVALAQLLGLALGIELTLPLNSVVLNRSIMRPSSTVPRASYSRTASG